jgi:hypothetical protein
VVLPGVPHHPDLVELEPLELGEQGLLLLALEELRAVDETCRC